MFSILITGQGRETLCLFDYADKVLDKKSILTSLISRNI